MCTHTFCRTVFIRGSLLGETLSSLAGASVKYAIDNVKYVSSVSQQEGSPFIVCMTYAFQTPEKLCFILDLMNGGDLHYHLSQHGVFTEKEVRFYAAEVMLGLEHMHSRFVVYRDLKVSLSSFGETLLCYLFLCCILSYLSV